MKYIPQHQVDERIYYCHAREEIPRFYLWDFNQWMETNRLSTFEVMEEQEPVYHPRHVKEYLQMKGYQNVEIIEDLGHLLRKIDRVVGESLKH